MPKNKNSFALKLSREKIQLLFQNEGTLEPIGATNPNEPQVTQNLRVLRAQLSALTNDYPLVDVILPDELILFQNITIEEPISQLDATKIISDGCGLKDEEVRVSVGKPTSERTQPIAAVTAKTIDETRDFLNNAGFYTNRFITKQNINGSDEESVFQKDFPRQNLSLNAKNISLYSAVTIFFICLLTTGFLALRPSNEVFFASNYDSRLISVTTQRDRKTDALDIQRNKFSSSSYMPPLISNPSILQPALELNSLYKARNASVRGALNLQKSTLNNLSGLTPKTNSTISKYNKFLSKLDTSSFVLDRTFNYNDFYRFGESMLSSYTLNQTINLHNLKTTVQDKHSRSNLFSLSANQDIYQKFRPNRLNTLVKEYWGLNNIPEIESESASKFLPSSRQALMPRNLPLNKQLSSETSNFLFTLPPLIAPPTPISISSKVDTDSNFFQDSLSISNIDIERLTSLNDFIQGEKILSEKYKPISRPILIASINVLLEPTLSSGAITLSKNPIKRPPPIMKTTRLSPESIKLSSKVTKKPSFPRRASVEKSATISNIIELNRTNLIGIFGTEIKAVALIRLTSGQIIKVKVGDRFEGWQVLSISKDKINLANGRTQETLRLPG